MTLRLTVTDVTSGQPHTHIGAVLSAIDEHLAPAQTNAFFARLVAAGGTHDAALCERCQAVAAAKRRAESEAGHAYLVKLARERDIDVDEPSELDRVFNDHVNAWHDTRLRYVEAYADDVDTQRQDRARALRRRMRDLTARVKACPPGQLPRLITELNSEVKRCRSLCDDMLLTPVARNQGKQLGALYSYAHDLAMTRFKNVMFRCEPKPDRRVRVKSTPRALGMIATYEAVCSCGHGYVN